MLCRSGLNAATGVGWLLLFGLTYALSAIGTGNGCCGADELFLVPTTADPRELERTTRALQQV